MTHDTEQPTASRERAAEIARGVVELTAKFTGRGPVKAQAYLADGCVTVVLTGVLTKGEKNLVDSDQAPAVEVAREAYQDALEQALTELVERITTRKVLSLLSASDVERDLTSHVFVFANA